MVCIWAGGMSSLISMTNIKPVHFRETLCMYMQDNLHYPVCGCKMAPLNGTSCTLDVHPKVILYPQPCIHCWLCFVVMWMCPRYTFLHTQTVSLNKVWELKEEKSKGRGHHKYSLGYRKATKLYSQGIDTLRKPVMSHNYQELFWYACTRKWIFTTWKALQGLGKYPYKLSWELFIVLILYCSWACSDLQD